MTQKYKLFLDDKRSPVDCVTYMNNLIYNEEWMIARNYTEFVKIVKEKGIPEVVSYDHDIASSHYTVEFQDWLDITSEQLGVEETGLDCAKWLAKYCHDRELLHPPYFVHSMNPVGKENIKRYLYGK